METITTMKRKREDDEDDGDNEQVHKKMRVATEMLIDDGDAQVPYEPAFFSKEEADGFFETLMKETEWQTETIKRWKKEIINPRRVYAFSDPNVKYRYIGLSRVGAAWTPTMTKIKTRVEDYCGVPFNFCFVNLYRNGQDTIGWHADDQKALIKGHQIASVTFSPKGGERDIFFKHKVTKKRTVTRLAHGSMYVMKGTTQDHYKHKIPRRPKVIMPRINLTFRQIDVSK
jgi:alkylated DNA repair dioxygenase AlkB